MERLLKYAGWLSAVLILLTVLAYAGIELRMFRAGVLTKVTVTDTTIAYNFDSLAFRISMLQRLLDSTAKSGGGSGGRSYVRGAAWNAPSVQVDSAGALYTVTGLTFDVMQWYGYLGSYTIQQDDSVNLPQAGASITTLLLPGTVYPFQLSIAVQPASGTKTGRGGMTWNTDVPPISPDSLIVVRIARRSTLNAGGTHYHASIYQVPFSQGGSPARTLGRQIDMIYIEDTVFPAYGNLLAIQWQLTMRRKRP